MSLLVKSKIDQRLYKSLVLSNKLSCLLISDKDTEKSAAAMNVNVGSLEDPSDREGLAHFCEHMLFMGTRKYPNESEYQEFISRNSGDTNAYTSSLNTNYIFQIANNSLQGALERFSQFFTEPLLDASCTEREMKAVDSEFNLHIQNDFWRKYQLQCSLSKEGNANQKFMIGNLKTLQHEDIRDVLLNLISKRLLEFHKRYYSSNVMKLVVYGQEPLETLEEWTKQLFGEITNQELNPPQYNSRPYDKSNLGKMVQFVPSKDEDYIEFVWYVDYLHPQYKSCPGSYISHLLGHEGENSLLSLLIDEGLASELSCGPNDEMRLYTTINVRIKLTKKGLHNIKSIVSFLFQYLEMLRHKGTQRWVFDETKAIRQLRFEYLEKQKPFGYVSELARRMQLYPIEELLQQPYFMEEFNEESIRQTINWLDEKNLMIYLSSKDLEGKLDLIEPYFGTQYSVRSIPEDLLAETRHPSIKPLFSYKRLDLPVKNIFLPKDTSLVGIAENEPTKEPIKILETKQSTLWFLRDTQFKVPKAIVQLRIYCNDQGYGQQIHTEALARLWQQLLKDHIRDLNYLAETAYIQADVDLASNGIDISSSGFSDSIPTFLYQLFKLIKEFDVKAYHHNFEQIVTKTKQKLENFKRQPPYQQVYSYQSVVLKSGGSFEPEQLYNVLQHITFEDLVKFQTNWLRNVRFEWLISGNIPVGTATELVSQVESIMAANILPKEDILEQRTINIPSGQTYNFTYTLPDETNSAVLLYYQHETMTLKSQLLNDIIANILKTPFFTQLRTQEQLGYVVFSMISDIRGITGFNFLVQSNSKSPQYCQHRIRTFLNEQMLQNIQKLTVEEFEGFKQSVRVALLEKDYSLVGEAGRLWNEIQKHQYLFDRKQQLLAILDAVALDEIIAFYETFFVKSPRVMEIQAVSNAHLAENETLKAQLNSKTISSSSVDWLKRRLPLYPDYYSML